MNLKMLESYGLAVRDGVYELFMEAAKVTELKELKEAGFEVKEVLMNPSFSQWDKFMLLVNDKQIICGCTVVVDWDKQDIDVEFYEGLEAKEYLRKLRLVLGETPGTSKPNKIH